MGFTDDQYLSYIDTLYVNYGDGVQPHFKVYNWGGNNPSENDYNDTLYVGITFNGADSGLVGWINYTDTALLIGYEQSLYFINDFLTPTQIANAGLLGGTYEMCLYLRLASGWVEQDPIDNTHCIDVIFLNNTVNNYTITATAGAGGTISPSGTNTYSEGANQTYTITPNTCYAIADVQVDGISVGAVSSYTFSIFKPITLFEPRLLNSLIQLRLRREQTGLLFMERIQSCRYISNIYDKLWRSTSHLYLYRRTAIKLTMYSLTELALAHLLVTNSQLTGNALKCLLC